MPAPSVVLTDQAKINIRKLYQDGMSATFIAKRLSIPVARVTRICRPDMTPEGSAQRRVLGHARRCMAKHTALNGRAPNSIIDTGWDD